MTSRRAFLLASAAAAAGCGRVKKAGARKLTVAVGSYHTMSPFYLARERGYFREAGLDIAIYVARTAAEAMPLMAQGTLDVGMFSNTPGMCNLIAQGARLRIAAAREYVTPCIDVGVIYESRKSFPAGDQDARAWKGKRVSVQSRGSINDYSLDTVRKRVGVADGAIHLAYLDRAAGLAALLSGGLDAIMNGFALPLDLGARRDEFRRNETAPNVMLGLQYSYVLFSKNVLDGDPELGADFLRAYFRGTRDYLAGATPVFLENWIRDNGVDREQMVKLCRDTLVPDGALKLADLQKYLDWYVDMGYTQPMKAESLADLRWLERAHRNRS